MTDEGMSMVARTDGASGSEASSIDHVCGVAHPPLQTPRLGRFTAWCGVPGAFQESELGAPEYS